MKNLILLPRYFKKIAFVLLVITAISYVLLLIFGTNLSELKVETLQQLLFGFASLALFFLNFYKRKDEDEAWILKRLHSLFFSFFIAINFYLLNALLNVVSNNQFYSIGAEIIFFILLFNWVQLLGLQAKVNKVEIENEQENEDEVLVTDKTDDDNKKSNE
ncbi:hypothetical protein K5I29_06705 [Flavobacterium agricola]|uniref:Uncharacterized protein n=1 Tax=Flavobacterium agricola TaxID=2870839 RepID=A0ABY6M1V8_9FLAO|nr:hypothetical protein [Flavobacterium agricola]UYW02557.1 hypothetical protein K5I29_06705 [Flavobacterium agricola]